MRDFEKLPGYVMLPREPLFVSKDKKNCVSAFLTFGLILAALFIGATVKHNQEVVERRLKAPVPTSAALLSVTCTTSSRRSRSPIAILEYQYRQSDASGVSHLFKTLQQFETPQDCERFKNSAEKTRTIWYEEAVPAKATLYPDEPLWWVCYGACRCLHSSSISRFEQEKQLRPTRQEKDQVRGRVETSALNALAD